MDGGYQAGAWTAMYGAVATTMIYVLRSAVDAWALVVEAADPAPGA